MRHEVKRRAAHALAGWVILELEQGKISHVTPLIRTIHVARMARLLELLKEIQAI